MRGSEIYLLQDINEFPHRPVGSIADFVPGKGAKILISGFYKLVNRLSSQRHDKSTTYYR